LLENKGYITNDCIVIADNVVYPGAPGFLEYVSSSNNFYNTKLISVPFERIGFETKWQQVDDAMSISKRNL
jgi:catechol O-methyltransferase/protein arginine N-methyltransferase 5